MKLLQKEGTSERNVPMLLLLTVGIFEFLFITMEGWLSGIGYYLTENYLIVPCLLLLGYVLREKPSLFVRRRLLLAASMICWFFIVQCIHRLSGMGNHPMGTVFFVYLMAFPFAALSEDRSNTGLWWIGGMFVASSMVLVLYTVLLMLNCVPAGLTEFVFWDGARLHAMWHPNINACYFMISIGFSAAICVQTQKSWMKVLLLAAIAAQFLAMALTNCRTILLLTGALLGGTLFFTIFRGNWKQFVLGLLAAAVVLVGSFKLSGMLFQWNNDRLLEKFIVSQEEASAEENATEEELVLVENTGIILGENEQNTLSKDMRNLNGRTDIWTAALHAIRDNKRLALWGTEYSGTVISAYHWFPVVHAHNSWVEVLMRMGVPGLMLSLVFTLLSVWSAARLVFRKGTETWKIIIVMTTMCIMAAGFLEPYLFITNVYYHVTDFIFLFLTGYQDYWCNNPEII